MRPPSFRIRTLMIAVAVAGIIGGMAGMLAGLLFPGVVSFVYMPEGDDLPASFSAIAWGARQGAFVGITLGATAWTVGCLIARLTSWRPRMTTRRWMVAVAVAAIAIYAWMLQNRATVYRDRAINWKVSEQGAILERDGKLLEAQVAGIDALESKAVYNNDAATRSAMERARYYRTQAEDAATRISYYAAMREKYERAARRPWLPVPPDLPAPK